MWSTPARTAAAIALAGAVGGCGGPTLESPGRTGSGLSARVGEPLIWGAIVVRNPGEAPVRLRAARLAPGAEFTVRRVMTAGPDRGFHGFGLFERPQVTDPRNRFRSERWRDLRGTPVPPARELTGSHDDVQVIFELEPVRPGRYEANGAIIEYESGGRVRELKVDDRFAVCAPRSCPTPEA